VESRQYPVDEAFRENTEDDMQYIRLQKCMKWGALDCENLSREMG